MQRRNDYKGYDDDDDDDCEGSDDDDSSDDTSLPQTFILLFTLNIVCQAWIIQHTCYIQVCS